MSMAPERTRDSHISKPCSPVSGCEMYRLSTSTPKAFAYSGSIACSASIYAAMPPSFCADATICSAIVVLPDDSGPKISIILPRGIPPTPRAASICMLPVGITEICVAAASPSFITEPLPNCFSICTRAASSAVCLSIFFLLCYIFQPSCGC